MTTLYVYTSRPDLNYRAQDDVFTYPTKTRWNLAANYNKAQSAFHPCQQPLDFDLGARMPRRPSYAPYFFFSASDEANINSLSPAQPLSSSHCNTCTR